ncbi:hypothetical protein FHU41_002212 [Psychromicrobium silvestre]|uniref:ABC-2 family transporter protein n=1 Tax=Psychromicrobium silvestre TaxID=1645614 RepID=A0A7Y9S935_9MICC|nr:ABC transporter permease [Psychromicrobium silvestre]NYE95962.1 hypothetical protein [Psychromicrobium silvestre]
MTTQTLPTAHRPAAGTHGVNFGGVLKSEIIKFWSLLSTKLLLIVSLVVIVGIGAFEAFGIGFATERAHTDAAAGNGPPGAAAQLSSFDFSSIPYGGIQLGMLILGALAVLFIASEYSTGMIRSSFSAVPSRLPVFGAKALVLIVVSYVLTTVGAFVTFLVAKPILGNYNIDFAIDQKGMLSGIFLCGLAVAGVTLMGLSLGVLLRNSAGGIVILAGALFVLPIAGNFLPLIPIDFFKYLPQYFPSEVAIRMLSTEHIDGQLDPWAAGLVFVGWVLVLLVPALVALKKRDA